MSRKSKVLSPVVTTTVYTMLSIMEGGPPPSEMTKASAISVHNSHNTTKQEDSDQGEGYQQPIKSEWPSGQKI